MADDPCDDWSAVFQPFASITIDRVQRIVADLCQVPVFEMKSARRSREVVRPRQIAMYLSSKLTRRSLPEIGRRFGGRDHSTVIYAIHHIEDLSKGDPQISRLVQQARHRIIAA